MWLLAGMHFLAVRRWVQTSETDHLTGVGNRAAFDKAVALQVLRGPGKCLSLVMLDVDHFKKVNDALGHPGGDAVLRQVGRSLRENTARLSPKQPRLRTVAHRIARELALHQWRQFQAFRYGGEEFAVILPDTELGDAVDLAEALRTAVARDVTGWQVTMSAGVATFPRHAKTDYDLLQAADEAVYDSKQCGRDRVTPAKPRM